MSYSVYKDIGKDLITPTNTQNIFHQLVQISSMQNIEII